MTPEERAKVLATAIDGATFTEGYARSKLLRMYTRAIRAAMAEAFEDAAKTAGPHVRVRERIRARAKEVLGR